jgi:hypothetical protein
LGYLLENFAAHSEISSPGRPFQERMRFLFMLGMSTRVESLPFKVWRDQISTMIHTAAFEWRNDNSDIYHLFRDKLAYFENELLKLKEITTILELALWKRQMNENCHQIKTDEPSLRRQCPCGSNVVIGHVLCI